MKNIARNCNYREEDEEFATIDVGSVKSQKTCRYCDAYLWPSETNHACCGAGKLFDKSNPENEDKGMKLVPDLPEEMVSLLDNPSYTDNIRAYNNAMAMASLGSNTPEQGVNFRVQGKLHHSIGSIGPPPEGEVPKFAALYFYDADHEVENRMSHQTKKLNPDILAILQEVLKRVNPYINSFQQALEIYEKDDNVKLVLLADKKKATKKSAPSGCLSLPQGCELAAIMHEDEHEHPDILVYTREGPVQRINPNHRSYDALHYVLLLPHGQDGWVPRMRGLTGKSISITQFYSFHLQIREGQFNVMLRGKKLSQQYFTDVMSKVERARLQFIRDNQKKLKAEKYQGLMDAKDNQDLLNAGRVVILPPTVTGSPRWYIEKLQDTLAIVRKLGKPTLFITVTCNPMWMEITQSLELGERWHDRPDIVARVFKAKLDQMMELITKKNVFGEVTYYVYTIEWQKRKGLPHAHLLLKLAEQPRGPDEIDKLICAELPSEEEPVLRKKVTNHMLHGPCGALNSKCPCMEPIGDSKKTACSKSFPKDFCKNTTVDDSSFPVYRRRSPEDGGETFTMPKGTVVDNRWIVPYNRYLLSVMDCHTNVVLVSSVTSVKYVFKYQHKGPDRVLMKLEDCNNSEVEQFVQGRWLSASESVWKLLGFHITERSHSVEKLPCHLEDEQGVFYEEGEEDQALVRGPPTTKLVAWFTANRENEFGCTLTYPEFPEHFVFQENKWVPRKRGFGEKIGRIPSIPLNPHTMEQYSLRLILHNKPGATSYRDLRTVDGEEQPNFQCAAIAMGLLEDDKELDKAMDEAHQISFGQSIRSLFLAILLQAHPSNPLQFYNDHKHQLIEDWSRDEEPAEAENKLLLWLEQRLLPLEMDLTKFNLPEPRRITGADSKEEAVIREETNYDQDLEGKKAIERMAKANIDQKTFFEAVLANLNSDDPGAMFCLDAPGGTGKTFVLNLLLSALRGDGHIALATALSAVASMLLEGGSTLHSKLKVPIDIRDNSLCSFTANTAIGKLMKRAKLLIIDEVSMGHKHIYEAIDRTLRGVRGTDSPMGGLCTIFAGDWRQCLPIIHGAGEAQVVNACLKNSYLWRNVTVLHLKENMRVLTSGSTEVAAHSQWLLDVGDGQCGEGELSIPPSMNTDQETIESLVDFVFPDLSTKFRDLAWVSKRAIMSPTNKEVEEVNDFVIKMIPGEQVDFKSIDDTEEGNSDYTPEFLNTIEMSGMPPHLLKLKKGAMVILLRNMDLNNGHCNGVKYVVQNIKPHLLELKAISGTNVGKFLLLPRILSISKSASLPFTLRRKQFPIKLSYGLSANKAQGQTLERAGIYLGQDFFSHGQAYVAFSRVGDKNNIKVLKRRGLGDSKRPCMMKNVVFKSVLV